jgi:CrcB protein
MRLIFLIGLGSFFGGVFRYLLSQLIHSKYLFTFPLGTFGVNILGSLLIGIVFGLSEKFNFPLEWKLFLATGILGGFTTFSAFSNETVSMLKEGQIWIAGSYILSSVLLGLLATYAGLSLIKVFV